MAEPIVTMTARVVIDKQRVLEDSVDVFKDAQKIADGNAIVYKVEGTTESLEKTIKKIQEDTDLKIGADIILKSTNKDILKIINAALKNIDAKAEISVEADTDSVKEAGKDIAKETEKISKDSKIEIDADTSKAQEQLKNLNKEQDKAQKESNESAKASQDQGKVAKDAAEKIKEEAKAVEELADAQGRYKRQKGEVGDKEYSYVERKGFAQDDFVKVYNGNVTHDLHTDYKLLEAEIKRVTIQAVDMKAKMDEASRKGIKTDATRENLLKLGETLHGLNEELDKYYQSQKHIAGGGNRNALTEDLKNSIAFRKNEIAQRAENKVNDNLNLDKDYQLNKLVEYESKLKELGLLTANEKQRISDLMNILASADSTGMQKFNKELRNFQQEMRPAIQSTEQFNKAWDDAIKENAEWERKRKESFSKDWDSAIVENNERAIRAYKELTKSANQYYDLQRKEAAGSLTKNEKERLTELRKLWQDATNGVKQYQIMAGNADSYAKAQGVRSDFLSSDKDVAISYSQKLQKTQASLQGLLNSGKYTTSLNSDLDKLIKKIEKINSTGIDLNNQAIINELGDIDQAVTKAFDEAKLADFRKAAESSIAKLNLKIEEFTKKNTKMGKEFREQFENLKLDWDTEHTTKEVQELVAQFAKLEAKVTKAEKTGVTFLDKVKDRLSGANAQLIAQYLSIQDIIRYVQTLAQNVIEVDTALTELRKVSDASTVRLSQSFEQSTKTAQELGRSITDVINSTADWSRAGFGIDAAEELARVSALYQNVGDNIDAATANEHLVSALRGFHKGAEDAERIVDIYNEVANNFSIDTAGIGEALQRSASVFYNASTDLESAVALVTGANEIVQDPSRVGNAWKTLSARIRASESELKEMGEETEGMFESTAKLRDYLIEMTGVDILDTAGQFRNLKDIVVDLGYAFEKIDNEFVKQEVAEKLAGKTQMNVLLSAISNYKQIEKAYDTAKGAAGSAAREQENYAKSVQYSIDRFHASVEELSYDLLDSKLLKDIVEAGNTIIQVIDKIIENIGGLEAAIGLASIAFGVKFRKEISSGLGNIITKLGTTTKVTETAVDALEGGSAALEMIQKGAELGADGMLRYSESVTATSKALGLLKLGKIVAGIGAVSFALYAGYKLWDNYQTSVSEWSDKINETTDKIKNLESEIKNLQDIDHRTQNEQDRLDALQKELEYEKQLLDIQNKRAAVQMYGSDSLAQAFDKDNAIRVMADDTKERGTAGQALDTTSIDVTKIDRATEKIKKYDEQLKSVSETSEEYGKISEKREKAIADSEDSYETLIQQTSHYQEVIEEASVAMKTLDPIANKDAYENAERVFKTYTGWLNENKTAIEAYQKAIGTYDYSSAISSIFQHTEYEKLKDELVELAQQGKLTKDVLESGDDALIKSLVADLKEAGVETDELYQYLLRLAGLVDRQNLVEKVNSQIKHSGGIAGVSGSDYDKTKLSSYINGLSEKDATIVAGLDVDWSTFNAQEAIDKMQAEIDKVGPLEADVKVEELSFTQSISDLKDLESALNNVGTAMANIDENGKFQLGDLDSIADYFLGLESAEKKVEYETEAVANALKLLGEGNGSIEQQADAVNVLADNYLRTSGILNGLTEQNRQLYTIRLQEMGIVNAEAIVEEQLALARQDVINATTVDAVSESDLIAIKEGLIAADEGMINASIASIQALLDEGNASNATRAAIFELVAQQTVFNNSSLSVNDKIAALERLASAFLSTAEAAKYSSQMSALSAQAENLEKNAGKMYDTNAVNAQKQSIENQLKRLTADYKDSVAKQTVEFTRAEYTGGSPVKNKLGYTPSSTSDALSSSAAKSAKDAADKAAKDAGKAAKDAKEEFEETIDFFERLVKVLDQKIDLLQAHLEDVVGSFAKNTLIDAQEDLIKQKMAGYSSAIDMYASKASEALSRVPSELQDAVQNGAVAVQDFVGEANEDVVDAINDYQGWADKVAECKQQVVELREELRKLEIQKFDNIVQDFEEINKVRQNSIDLIDKEIALFEESRDKIVGRGFYDAKIEQTQKQMNSLYEERTKLVEQANEALANGIKISVPCHSNVA